MRRRAAAVLIVIVGLAVSLGLWGLSHRVDSCHCAGLRTEVTQLQGQVAANAARIRTLTATVGRQRARIARQHLVIVALRGQLRDLGVQPVVVVRPRSTPTSSPTPKPAPKPTKHHHHRKPAPQPRPSPTPTCRMPLPTGKCLPHLPGVAVP